MKLVQHYSVLGSSGGFLELEVVQEELEGSGALICFRFASVSTALSSLAVQLSPAGWMTPHSFNDKANKEVACLLVASREQSAGHQRRPVYSASSLASLWHYEKSTR